jgi:hypothetical protein
MRSWEGAGAMIKNKASARYLNVAPLFKESMTRRNIVVKTLKSKKKAARCYLGGIAPPCGGDLFGRLFT